jgi:UDP-N-acetylmuramate: L-alanyl-gamma-D-glutamyl-meso-diaminopimelate ligase
VRKLAADGSSFDVLLDGAVAATVSWGQLGDHNVQNALVAIAAARHAGVPVDQSAAALQEFSGVKRRMEVRGQVGGVTLYDDFAHHPTAIATTLQGLRRRVGDARILLVLEPRSNTMRMGVHRDTLAASLLGADRVWLYEPEDLAWSLAGVAQAAQAPTMVSDSVADIVAAVARAAMPGDHVLVMSNGDFGGIYEKLLNSLK